jgi:hypothetical protein
MLVRQQLSRLGKTSVHKLASIPPTSRITNRFGVVETYNTVAAFGQDRIDNLRGVMVIVNAEDRLRRIADSWNRF